MVKIKYLIIPKGAKFMRSGNLNRNFVDTSHLSAPCFFFFFFLPFIAKNKSLQAKR